MEYIPVWCVNTKIFIIFYIKKKKRKKKENTENRSSIKCSVPAAESLNPLSIMPRSLS